MEVIRSMVFEEKEIDHLILALQIAVEEEERKRLTHDQLKQMEKLLITLKNYSSIYTNTNETYHKKKDLQREN